MTPANTAASKSSGVVSLKEPFLPRPMAVRTALTITTSSGDLGGIFAAGEGKNEEKRERKVEKKEKRKEKRKKEKKKKKKKRKKRKKEKKEKKKKRKKEKKKRQRDKKKREVYGDPQKVLSRWFGVKVLLKPKSMILMFLFSSSKRFSGLRSL